jgi:hypothetical protein
MGLIDTVKAFLKFNWADMWIARAQQIERHDRRHAAILKEHREWFGREWTRAGAAIQGAAPDQVQEAYVKTERARAATLRAYFVEADRSIARERKKLVAAILETADQLRPGLKALAAFDAEYRKFAEACGESRPRPSSARIEAIIDALTHFQDIERRREAPPAVPVTYQPPETNPVKVPAEI